MFLFNRLTERNAMKNKEKLKQRVISPKLPPSQPVEHLCVLFSAKNDAVGCQCLPVGFPRVSPLLHPSFTAAGERKHKENAEFQMSVQNPASSFYQRCLLQFVTCTAHIHVTQFICITATILSIANWLCSLGFLAFPLCYLVWYHRPPALVGALVLDHRIYVKNNTIKYSPY